MKQFGQLICTIAILTQIILSSGWVKVHQPDCQSSQTRKANQANYAALIGTTQTTSHAHSCNCGHHHDVQLEQPGQDDQNDQQAPTLATQSPNSPCTCQSSNPDHYIQLLSLVETSSAKQYIASTQQQSLILSTAQALALTLPSNPPPPDTHRHNSGSYLATHVGIYLL